MQIYVVSITDEYNQVLVQNVFSGKKLADDWVNEYIRANWNHYFGDDPIPDNAEDALQDYFYGTVVECENLNIDICDLDKPSLPYLPYKD